MVSFFATVVKQITGNVTVNVNFLIQMPIMAGIATAKSTITVVV
ncbi:hypothetical protein [Tepidibacillus marianensis]